MPPARKPSDEVLLPGEEAPAAPRARAEARRVQAAAGDPALRVPEDERATETAAAGLTAPIAGRRFRLNTEIGLMPLMEWAAAVNGLDVSDGVQVLSLYRLLREIVDPGDWAEFKTFTTAQKCDSTAFISFQNAALEAIAALPTREPGTS